MWDLEEQFLDDGQIRQVSLWQQGQLLSYAQVIDQWQHSAPFRDFFITTLARVSFPAYFWETPPLTEATQDQPFAFVQVHSPSLATAAPNLHAFHAYFAAREAVVTFANLGGDAFLVVPTPQAPQAVYTHLAAFTREAPPQQQHALWQTVAAAIKQRLGHQPLWVSTSGLGVYWLHIRLDSRPKYYTYRPYRQGH